MSDIVITRQQLEAWATAIKGGLNAWGQPPAVGRLALEQALEDMTDELTDPEEIDIVDDAAMYDPDRTELDMDDDYKPTFV